MTDQDKENQAIDYIIRNGWIDGRESVRVAIPKENVIWRNQGDGWNKLDSHDTVEVTPAMLIKRLERNREGLNELRKLAEVAMHKAFSMNLHSSPEEFINARSRLHESLLSVIDSAKDIIKGNGDV